MSESIHRRILDLSECDEWSTTTWMVIQNTFSSDLIEAAQEVSSDNMFEDTLSFLVDNSQDCQSPMTTEEIEYALDEEYLKLYTHFRAFHACRTADVESYRSRGILKLSETLLHEIAHRALGETIPESEINAAIGDTKIQEWQRCVNLFTDQVSAQDSRQNHYLQNGSEELQRLIQVLGRGCRGILAGQGLPYLVECEIPINIVAERARHETWKELVTMVFKKISSNDPGEIYVPDSCIWVYHDISPDWIKQFITVDENEIEYNYAIRH